MLCTSYAVPVSAATMSRNQIQSAIGTRTLHTGYMKYFATERIICKIYQNKNKIPEMKRNKLNFHKPSPLNLILIALVFVIECHPNPTRVDSHLSMPRMCKKTNTCHLMVLAFSQRYLQMRNILCSPIDIQLVYPQTSLFRNLFFFINF